MPDKPSLFPRWATDGGAAVTEPSEGTKDTGWTAGNPELDYDNWLKLITYLQLLWMDQVMPRALDFLRDDQILPGHTALPAEFSLYPNHPTWDGVRSTTVPAAWFSGGAVISGYRHGPIPFPGATFTDERDVYIDLGKDGEWDVTEVANGAGEPTLAADHVRFFMFVTNASQQITDGVYYKAGHEYVDNGVPMRFDAGAIVDEATGLGINGLNDSVVLHDGPAALTLADNLANGTVGAYGAGAINPDDHAGKELLAFRNANVVTGSELAWGFAVNARRTDTGWAREHDGDSYLFLFADDGPGGFMILQHVASEGATWGNSISASTWVVVGQFGAAGGGLNAGNLQVDENGDVLAAGDIETPGMVTAADVVAADVDVSTLLRPLAIEALPGQDLDIVEPVLTSPMLEGTTIIRGIITPATLSTSQDDYNPTGLDTATILRLTASSPVNITGLAGGTQGRMITLINTVGETITLQREDAGSSAGNRFAFSNASIALADFDTITLWYDATSSRWRPIGGNQG